MTKSKRVAACVRVAALVGNARRISREHLDARTAWSFFQLCGPGFWPEYNPDYVRALDRMVG